MKQIKNYIYESPSIGKGTFSKVYKGYNINDKTQTYAIKKIYRNNKEKYIKYVEKEIAIMEKLNHINIIKLYNKIYTDKYIFLILELCEMDLNTYIQTADLNEDTIKYIIRQIIEAIKYIMDNNIVHRDLKPHNILINTNTNNIKLCDFGFAREFKDTLLTDTICGSPLYMAPELLRNRKYNIKSDLWSLGIIIYEMVMKDHPFKANNINDLLTKIMNNKPIIYNNNITEECKELINSLLIIDYKKRMDWEDVFSNKWIYNTIDEIEESVVFKSIINNSFKMDEDNYTDDDDTDSDINTTYDIAISMEENNDMNYFNTGVKKTEPIAIKKNNNKKIDQDYVFVRRPRNNSMISLMNDSVEYLKNIFK